MIGPIVQNTVQLRKTYTKLLGTDWTKILFAPLLNTPYMEKLRIFIYKAYQDTQVFPKKDLLFSNFIATNFEKLRVVVVGMEPYHDYRSTGIPLSNAEKWGGTFSPELEAWRRGIEQDLYDGLNLGFDPEFRDLCAQGVFFLDCASTSIRKTKLAHLMPWRNFVRQTLIAIASHKPEVIFLFLGDEARYFKKYVKKANFVVQGQHPREALLLNQNWNARPLKEVNDILAQNNGEGHEIHW